MSTPPTSSIESERIFLAVAFIGNTLRSRLRDKKLNALLFLRANFQSRKYTIVISNYFLL